ncbi:hypothetical protein N183_34915 [Sinorhizobium sp. Sb3]|nr:hypothetical protein N183_34915 [Sinorhizobium sp. Sb3]
MPANLAGLPVEIQVEILGHLVRMDLDDPQTALRGVAAFRRTSKSLHQATGIGFRNRNIEGNKRIASHIHRLGQGLKGLDEIPRPIKAENRTELNIEHTAMNADFITLLTADKRADTVRDVLKLEHSPKKLDSVESLIFNIDYVDSKSRSRIVKDVCDLQRDSGGAEDLVKKLIERTEALTPADRAFLVNTSCGIEDAAERRDCLNAWAGRTHLLANHRDELNVLSRSCEDSDGKGYSLGMFTMDMSKVSPEIRPLLIRNVIDLPADHPGRMWAVSHLAANFSHLGEPADASAESLRREIARDILDKVSSPSRERVSEDPALWRTEPSLCLIEAVHHLSSHKHLLVEDEIKGVSSYIERILRKEEVEAYPTHAQLISHLDEKRRRGFVGNALAAEGLADLARNNIHEKSVEEGVILALALRVKDLTPEERKIYVDHVCSTERGIFVEEALRYNFNQHLGDFKSSQRTDLVNERLDYFVRHESEEAAKTLLDIAQNAKFLKANDILNVIKNAKGAAIRAYHHSDDHDPMINSFAGTAARALANWSTEILSNGRNLRGLDDRSSERSFVR